MGIYETILARRTIRKFKQEKIDDSILKKLLNAARHAPSAANIQPIKYIIVNDEEKVNEVFKHVKWAAYIAPHGTPSENEKPVAFIIILIDTEIKRSDYELDVGAAAQNIFLAAWEEGIGTCWMGAVNRDAVRKALNIDNRYIINTVIALGYMAEAPVVEDENGSIKYYKDEKGVLHVPKRKLDDIILKL
ncbi:MAG TPA: nitroreductase [Clostridiaceae bacterium]|nr:nitroreductase [Clostridiaceae bacterium]